jgi:hypothetical protein
MLVLVVLQMSHQSTDTPVYAKLVKFGVDVGSGGVAASIAKTLNSPFEVAKLILQTQPGRFNGLSDLLIRLPKEVRVREPWHWSVQ